MSVGWRGMRLGGMTSMPWQRMLSLVGSVDIKFCGVDSCETLTSGGRAVRLNLGSRVYQSSHWTLKGLSGSPSFSTPENSFASILVLECT